MTGSLEDRACASLCDVRSIVLGSLDGATLGWRYEQSEHEDRQLACSFEQAPGRLFGQPFGIAGVIALGHRCSPASEFAERKDISERCVRTSPALELTAGVSEVACALRRAVF